MFQGDTGYYSGTVAARIAARGALFRLAVPRSKPLWRAVSEVPPIDGARHRIATVRRLLIARGARLTRTGRRNELHFTAPASELIAQALARIRTHRTPAAA